MIRIDILKLRM